MSLIGIVLVGFGINSSTSTTFTSSADLLTGLFLETLEEILIDFVFSVLLG